MKNRESFSQRKINKCKSTLLRKRRPVKMITGLSHNPWFEEYSSKPI